MHNRKGPDVLSFQSLTNKSHRIIAPRAVSWTAGESGAPPSTSVLFSSQKEFDFHFALTANTLWMSSGSLALCSEDRPPWPGGLRVPQTSSLAPVPWVPLCRAPPRGTPGGLGESSSSAGSPVMAAPRLSPHCIPLTSLLSEPPPLLSSQFHPSVPWGHHLAGYSHESATGAAGAQEASRGVHGHNRRPSIQSTGTSSRARVGPALNLRLPLCFSPDSHLC